MTREELNTRVLNGVDINVAFGKSPYMVKNYAELPFITQEAIAPRSWNPYTAHEAEWGGRPEPVPVNHPVYLKHYFVTTNEYGHCTIREIDDGLPRTYVVHFNQLPAEFGMFEWDLQPAPRDDAMDAARYAFQEAFMRGETSDATVRSEDM